MSVEGIIYFVDNEVSGDGGAVYALSLSQILLAKEASLLFIGNVGK